MIGTKQTSDAKRRQAELLASAHVKPRRNWMRFAGNALIISGLLLMIGVGSYLGLQAYNNDQTTQRIEKENAGVQDLIAPPVARATITRVSDNANTKPATPVASNAGSAPTPAAEGTPAPAGSDPATAVAEAPAAPTDEPDPAPPTDRVLVDSLPLPDLNTGTGGLNFGAATPNEPPTQLMIPSVGIDSKVVPVGWDMIPGKDGRDTAEWNVAEYAVGHHQGSANPGQVGNVVMSGHVDWKGEVFKNLIDVKRGDQVYVKTGDREFLYIIQGATIVKEDGPDVTDEMRRENARFMDPTPDQTLTMITCYPYGIDDHRLIVIAKPYDSGLPARPDLNLK